MSSGALAMGVNVFLARPYKSETLLEALQGLLGTVA